ncbi:MAG: glycoside hydrolase family 13 protein [Oscillospiraceae bacterium]|nr:MAG: glycoside hydrolase family 13 protein [Oscillospiraceae bacterium]
MLPKNPAEALTSVTFEKYGTGERAGENLTRFGAFAWGEVVSLRVGCPRRLGVTAVVLRINRDGQPPKDMPFTFLSSDYEQGQDICELELDTAALCGLDAGGRRSGLFFYRLLLVRDQDTLFTDSRNNVDFTLGADGGQAFRLLVYNGGDPVPEWFGQGVLYHVFVDRFRRGAGAVRYRTGARGAVMEPDWAHGIPPFAERQGDSLANNTFFGGNLWGVAEALDYLADLGVRVLYLSPIFRAYSNHKYDTGDYLTVDEGFGGEAALDALLDKAKRYGIAVILDGVFNHTGDDSRYFNRYGTYPDTGAYQSPDSPYRDWYEFSEWPDRYASWWGIPILPKLNHKNDVCRSFFTGVDGVGARYIRRGIAGWRLDVADELSDDFLDEFHASVRAAGAESARKPVIIGEVWENAAEKTAYGRRRRYLQGGQLDSVMNYPVRSGILAFVCDRDAEMLYDVLTELYASYPRPVSDSLMNLIGTHDTERILTVLGSEPGDYDRPTVRCPWRGCPRKSAAPPRICSSWRRCCNTPCSASLRCTTVMKWGLRAITTPSAGCRSPGTSWKSLSAPICLRITGRWALCARTRPESRRVPACRARCRLARLPPLRRARLRRLRQRRGSFDRRQPQFRTG